MRRRRTSIVPALLLCTAVCQAGVTYDRSRRTIVVTGFSERRPGTLADVLRAAARGRWRVVTYDARTQTFVLKAGLEVGAKDGSSTLFRIGVPERPRETLIIRGNIRVVSPMPLPGYLRFKGCNGLWIGDPDHPDIRPALLFDCRKKNEFGLLVEPGCSLRVAHARVSVVRQNRRHTARCEMKCRDVQLIDSTLEWLDGPCMTYGFESIGGIVRGVTFQHGRCAFGNGAQWVRNCVFRDLDVAVRDSGALNATFIGCRFEHNRRNWELAYTDSGILAIDCTFGRSRERGPHIRRWKNPETGRWQHPAFVSLRHLVISVRDERNRPVSGALVRITESSGDPSAVHHGLARTNAAGRTPLPGEYGALLVADYAYRATDDAPTRDSRDCRIAAFRYRYDIRVRARGFRELVVRDVDPDESWTEKNVVLRSR